MSTKEAGKRPQQLLNYRRAPPPFPPPNCPRCSSGNTKFCYYNNYSVSQPRYLCKDCRRYWTHGGVLRNIPSGGASRKRGRADCASSSSQISKPPPTAWSTSSHNPASAGADSGDGHGTFRPQITQTMQSFNGGGFFHKTPFKFNPHCELGGANTAFGAVNVAFGGGAPPRPTPSTMMLPQLSQLTDFREFGIAFVQRPQQHYPPPQPHTVWAGQNMALTSTSTTLTSPNNFLSIARDATAAANVVSIKEWSELNDMDNEGDPLQSYKPPSP